MADDEIWGTIEEDLENVRVKVSVNKNLQSLKNLCLNKVVDILDVNCKALRRDAYFKFVRYSKLPKRLKRERVPTPEETLQFVAEPFKDLPPVLMSSLQRRIEEKKRNASHPTVLPYLVNANTQRLVVEIQIAYEWTHNRREALMQRIRDKGQNISELTFSPGYGDSVTPVLLQGMLGVLTKLTSLNLQGVNFDNSFVATIGSCCPQLRNLNLSISGKVTDEGLRYLYDSNLPCGPNGEEYGQCTKLTQLDVKGCYVTIDGLVSLLSNLPKLVYLKCRLLYEAIAKTNEAQLKLQSLNVGGSVEEDTLASVISKVPDIRKLDIFNNKIKNIDQFFKLEHVSDLRMSYVQSLCPSQITSLITNYSQTLTKLELSYYNNTIDISIIGFQCHQLVQFAWGVSCTTYPKHKLLPSIHFSKIKKMNINPNEDSDVTISVEAWKCILASPHLEEFISRSYRVLGEVDSTLNWLVEEARAHRVVFSKLRELDLRRDVSTFWTKRIVCVAPRLKILKLQTSKMRDVEYFMRQHGLKHCRVKDIYAEYEG